MKKFSILTMTALLLTVFNGCRKEDPNISQMTDDSQTPKQGQIINYHLDNVPIIENNQVLGNLLKNEDDPEDEKINKILNGVSDQHP